MAQDAEGKGKPLHYQILLDIPSNVEDMNASPIKLSRDMIDHITRHQSFLLTVTEGLIQGKNYRGHARRQDINQIITDVGCR